MIANHFPNGTVYLTELLSRKKPLLALEDLYALSSAERAVCKKKGDKLTQSMILLNNSKNEPMKRALSIAYSNGNKECYLLYPEAGTTLQTN